MTPLRPRLPAVVQARIASGTTIVTATRRLAREYQHHYNLRQMSEGESAWESADILPVESWLKRSWQTLRLHHPPTPILINDLQRNLVWGNIIREDIRQYEDHNQPLWNITSTASTAVKAWKLIHQWDIDLAECATSFQPDHRSFARWANRFRQLCADKNWLDSAQLIDAIIQILSFRPPSKVASNTSHPLPEHHLLFAGFDQITPQQQRLVSCLEDYGITVEIMPVQKNTGDPPPAALKYQDEAAQWRAAAHWARVEQQREPRQHLGIIVPNLSQSSTMIRHALIQVLCPGKLLEPGSEADYPFHISLGKRLAQFPVIDSALRLLQLSQNTPLSYENWARIFLCPHIAGAETERDHRSQFEWWARRHLPYQVGLSSVIGQLRRPRSRPACPALFAVLCQLQDLIKTQNATQTFKHWVSFYRTFLETAGWPGEKILDTDEFQTVSAFHRHLFHIESIDLVSHRASSPVALSVVRHYLSQQFFQTETADVPISVVDVWEAAGLQFDAVWFGGLSEKAWPTTVQSSPFIPRPVQERAGIPRSSVKTNHQLAQVVQQRIECDSNRLIFSRHCHEQEVKLAPSPLFPESDSQSGDSPPPLAQYLQNDTELQWLDDDTGLAVEAPPIRGGTALIQDQAICPFRAYARYRLGAVDRPLPSQDLDALAWGSLIHDILEDTWRRIRTSDQLETMTPDQLKTVIHDSVAKAGARYAFVSGNGKQFLQFQYRWLERLVRDWFEIEKNRAQPFHIKALEKQMSLWLGGLRLQLKIDRIDQLADGTLALIDYKTGFPAGLGQWFGTRPEAPQLPLYAMACAQDQSEKLTVLAFAHIRQGHSGYKGISHSDNFHSNSTGGIRVWPLEKTDHLKNRHISWDDMQQQWCTHLGQLAEDFQSGKAAVDPARAHSCTYCDLHGLCRIDDIRRSN